MSISVHNKRKKDPFILKFIDEFKKHECLWNVQHKDYHLKGVATRAWLDIAAQMDTEVTVLRSKWKNLKDSYRKEFKKNFIDNEYQGIWLYFDVLDFLRETIDLAEKTDNEEANLDESSSQQSVPEEYLKRKRRRESYHSEAKIDDDDEVRFDEQFLVSLLPFLRRLDPIRKLMVRSRIQAAVVEELSNSRQDSD